MLLKAPEKRSNLIFYVGLFATVLFTIILRFRSFGIPVLDVDETVFGTVAASLLSGGNLYIDAADIKPPMIFWLYELVWRFFGEWNMLALHIIASIWVVLTACVIGLFVKKVAGQKAGAVSMFFYPVLVSLGDVKILSANINLFMALPVVISAYFFVNSNGSRKWLCPFVSGAFGAVAAMFRVQGGFILIAESFYALIEKDLSKLIYLWLGALSAFLLVTGIMLANGSFNDAVYWSLSQGFYYAGQGGTFSLWPRLFSSLGSYLYNYFPFILASLLWVVLWMVSERKEKNGRFVIAWFIMSWPAIVLGRRFYPHYYLLLAPVVAVMTGLCFSCLTRRALKIVVFAILVCWSVFRATEMFKYSSQGDWSEISEVQCPIGEYVRSRSFPEDKIFVWGFSSPVYFCADRLPATRFVNADALVGRVSGGEKFKKTGAEPTHNMLQEKAWAWLFEDFSKHSPKYIVDMSDTKTGDFVKYRIEDYPIYGWMQNKGYELKTSIRGARLYRRLSDSH